MDTNEVEQYIKRYPSDVQNILQTIRRVIHQVVPGGVDLVSYGIPTVDFNGKHVVHFAAFKHHIGFFPTPSPIPVFHKELIGYKTSKGTIQFPLDKPIPYRLIRRITAYRVKELAMPQQARSKKK